MKNSIIFKFLAILLATLCLLTAVSSVLCIAALIATDLYSSTPEEEYEVQMYYERRSLAVDLVHNYVTLNLGGIPEEYYEQYYGYGWKDAYFQSDFYFYSIYDDNGAMVSSTMPDDAVEDDIYEIEVNGIGYRVLATAENGMHSDDYFDDSNNRYIQVWYNTEEVSGYTVQLYLLEGAYVFNSSWQLLNSLYAIRYQLFLIFGAAVLMFLSVTVYLCCAAGRNTKNDQIRPGGLNRLPLDLYTAAVGFVEILLVNLALYLLRELIDDIPKLMICLLALIGSVCCLAIVGLIFAWAAQLKAPDAYWRKNTLIGRVIGLALRFLHWIGRGIRWCFRAIGNLLRMMPVMWQGVMVWLVIPILLMVFSLLFFCLFVNYGGWYPFWAAICLILCIACVGVTIALPVYCAYCFGVLIKAVKRMSQGDLNTKISTHYLRGSFRDFAIHLNSLSDAISVAAEKQLRSERMKTELITNVSHDIKTPLTSIINFVDLLQKAHTPEEEQEYLEVLSRQSGQMKKLIEDLMELSKASSGNLTVNLQKMDAVEAVNQALGEFSDKLDAAGLTPIFRQPEQPIHIMADGRHVWRVLFNLLTNAVKYALPGTRLYIDLMQAENRVILSLKNVSKAELNISAEELMERFVQGDASRKSEGSGLGLNIAKSLMEVQGGTLQLLLDGDLFKVTLTFPSA